MCTASTKPQCSEFLSCSGTIPNANSKLNAKMNLQSKMKSEITLEHMPSSSKQVVSGCSVLDTLAHMPSSSKQVVSGCSVLETLYFVLAITHFVCPSPHTLEM